MSRIDKKAADAFTARIGLGLRELDGLEQPPDVSAVVARRLHERSESAPRSPLPWLGVAAALLAAIVTATLLVRPYFDRPGGDPDAVVAAQDPAGPWQLVYELPIEALQRSLRDNPGEDLEQLLARCVRNLQARIGAVGAVTRSDATTVTIDLADASSDAVARVRAMVETVGWYEMRMVADADYAAPGVRFDMQQEDAQLRAWLDAGGRERLAADLAAIADYRAGSGHLRWYPRRIRPDPRRPGRWSVRYSDLHLGVVAVSAELDWNDGAIPAHLQARPRAEQFLIELFPLNMHEIHFTGEDLEPNSIAVVADRDDGLGSGVGYRFRGDRAMAYADFTERWIGKCCAMLWDGEVLSAPRFESRIPGAGRLCGLSRKQADVIATAMHANLPGTPRLLRAGPRKAK